MEISIRKFIPVIILIVNFICKITGNVDAPTTTTSPSNLTPRQELLRRMRQRYMNTLSRIRQQILDNLNWNTFPVIQDRATLLRNVDLSRFRMTSEHCYAADCQLPNWIDDDMWNDPSSNVMNVRFDVFSSGNGDVNVTNATLRLYMNNRTYCQCSADADQNRLNVKIYQYLRPLRRRWGGTPKKRIMDTQMINWVPNTWVTFSVTRAADDWVTQRRRRNSGFAVAVFDEYDNPVDAKTVFSNVDCARAPDMDCSEIDVTPFFHSQFNISSTPSLHIVQTQTPTLQRKRRDIAPPTQKLSTPTKLRNLLQRNVDSSSLKGTQSL